MEDLFIGLDLSTQQVKAILLDGTNTVVHREAVNFGKDLPQYGTKDGSHFDVDRMTVTSPMQMWLHALDIVFEKLNEKFDLQKVRGISGCAQQHGTVYWANGGEKILNNLKPSESLRDGLKNAFATNDCPIWMDSSTDEQCFFLEESVGGAENLCKLTGSRAHQRFSGAQIKKMHDKKVAIWKETEKVSIISSFLTSLLSGQFQGVEYTDGSGTSLMSITKNEWIPELLEAAAPNLSKKIGPLIPPNVPVGAISHYFNERFNINKECRVLPFLGDNPASLAGLAMNVGDVGVSLGTSDTLFFTTNAYNPCVDAHVFAHFQNDQVYMPLVCFKNGSLTRERIKKRVGVEWDSFSDVLAKTKIGNDGNIGFFYDVDEIIPRVNKGDRLFDIHGEKVADFTDHATARAVFESQCLLKRYYAEKMGLKASSGGRLLVTGGASGNVDLQQMLADVFDMQVYVINVVDSAALGGAMRARYDFYSPTESYENYYSDLSFTKVADPSAEAHKVYNEMVNRLEGLIEKL